MLEFPSVFISLSKMQVPWLTLLLFGVSFFDPMDLQGILSPLQTRKVFMVVYSKNCDGKTYPVSTENMTFIRHGSSTSISGNLVVSEVMKSPVPGELQITRCEEMSDPSSCKLYNTLKWHDSCDFTKFPLLLKTFIDKIEPTFACPVKKGRYTFQHENLQTDFYAQVLDQNSRVRAMWILHTIEWAGNQTFFCYEIGVRIGNARIRP